MVYIIRAELCILFCGVKLYVSVQFVNKYIYSTSFTFYQAIHMADVHDC